MNAEFFRIGQTLPPGFIERLVVPAHVSTAGHPLSPYVANALIPKAIDVFLLKDLNGFYHRLSNNGLGILTACRGLYVAENHRWMPADVYQKTAQALQREYGIAVKDAILLPLDRIDYWTMIHEGLHAVFNRLSPDVVQRIIESAVQVYDFGDKFDNMLNLTHLNISHFDWNLGQVKAIADRHKKQGTSSWEEFEGFSRLSGLIQMWSNS